MPSAPGGPSTKLAGNGDFELSPSVPAVSGTSSFRGRGAFRALAKLAIQAAEALDHAHVMGILHRDIKPSNLMVDARGNLWVTDFGLARFQNEPGLTRTGDLLGTLRYIAPELVLGQRMVHDPRSDIYSLGATLYELLTLRPVFDGRDRQEVLRQIAHAEPIPPRRLDPTIPRDLETIVLQGDGQGARSPLHDRARACRGSWSLSRGQDDPRPPSDPRRAHGEVGSPASRGARCGGDGRVPGAGHRRPACSGGSNGKRRECIRTCASPSDRRTWASNI